MSALMRGAKLAKEPLLLLRKRPATAPAAPLQPAVAPSRPLPSTSAYQRNADERQEAEPQTPPRMTYAEFERQAGSQLEAVKREAREQGLREGREAALAKARQEQSAQLEAAAAVIRSARASLDQGIAGLTDIGVEIAFEAAAKIVGRASMSAEGAVAIVREVVQRARDRSRLVLRVSRADYAWIDAHRVRLLEGLEPGSVEIVADDRVVLGGCIVETPTGNLDGRLETQLAGLRDSLLAARSQRPVPEADA